MTNHENPNWSHEQREKIVTGLLVRGFNLPAFSAHIRVTHSEIFESSEKFVEVVDGHLKAMADGDTRLRLVLEGVQRDIGPERN